MFIVNVKPGWKFGKWTILEELQRSGYERRFLCRCDCGNVKPVFWGNLTESKSNGCHKCPRLNRRLYDRPARITPEWQRWSGMKNRCLNSKNPSYPRYGGRGITVCDRWSGKDGFINFLEDMGPLPTPKHTIERQNSNGPYSPENCVWDTALRQGRNRSIVIKVNFEGQVWTLPDLANAHGLSRNLLYSRIKCPGWDLHRALTQPVRVNTNGSFSLVPIKRIPSSGPIFQRSTPTLIPGIKPRDVRSFRGATPTP